jgi:nucleotide-binding universal stress UspA family protein
MVVQSVLCAVDFSDGSRAALRAAIRVVRHFHATLHVLFVEDPLLASAAVIAAPGNELVQELREFVAATAGRDLPATTTFKVAVGRAADEIVCVAEQRRADVIVVGTHGLTGVRKAFVGSTTARLLRRSTRAVVMVPAAAGAGKERDLAGLGSILVLTDFGAAAARAADVAAQLAARAGSRLVLVHVMPPAPVPESWQARAQAATESRSVEAHRNMCEAAAPLERYGPVDSVIVEGNVAGRVADLVRGEHAGLIVMGLESDAHGARPGSTAYSVVCTVPVPVLAIPMAPVKPAARLREFEDITAGE